MKQFTRSIVVGDLTEQDFLNWKHHPVTKLWLRYLKDYERQMGEQQVSTLRSCVATPDPFGLGAFTGAINAVMEMADPQFAAIVEFYPPDEEEAEGQE